MRRIIDDAHLCAHEPSRHHLDADLRLVPAIAELDSCGDASATFWLDRRLGLGIGGYYRQGFGSDYGIQTDTQAGGAVSIHRWLSPRTLFSLAYRRVAPLGHRVMIAANPRSRSCRLSNA